MSGCHNSESFVESKKECKKCLCEKMYLLEIRLKQLEESDYDERISDIENLCIDMRLLNLEKKINIISPKPHKCPVCEGYGQVKLSTVDSCHTCSGKGIVWG